jgi:phosphatidate cytidylyltransferase
VTNLAQRVAVGVVAIPAIYVLCMAGGPYFFGFVALASALALREFYALAEAKGVSPHTAIGIVGGLFVNVSFFHASSLPAVSLAVVLPAVVVLVSIAELFFGRGSAILNLATTIFGVLYVSLFFGTLVGIREIFASGAFPVARYFPLAAGASLAGGAGGGDPLVAAQIYRWGGAMVMSMFVTIWICDSAAFHVGSEWGAHKMAPRVSPNKSWEGAAAGLAGAMITAVAAKYLVLEFLPLGGAFLVGALVGTVGQTGDLVESLLKRDAGVKDSSTMIPGHGGVFDRFDSVLLVAPCVFLYLERILFA